MSDLIERLRALKWMINCEVRGLVPDTTAYEAADEIERLRTRLEVGEDYDGIGCRDETIRAQDALIERLRAALEIAQSWLDRWAAHVGNCTGGGGCTCGLTRIRLDVDQALGTAND